MAECIPNTILFPVLPQGSHNLHMLNHGNESTPNEFKFGYPLDGDSIDDQHVDHGMTFEEYDSSMGTTSQWQHTYITTSSLMNSIVQNQHPLI